MERIVAEEDLEKMDVSMPAPPSVDSPRSEKMRIVDRQDRIRQLTYVAGAVFVALLAVVIFIILSRGF